MSSVGGRVLSVERPIMDLNKVEVAVSFESVPEEADSCSSHVWRMVVNHVALLRRNLEKRHLSPQFGRGRCCLRGGRASAEDEPKRDALRILADTTSTPSPDNHLATTVLHQRQWTNSKAKRTLDIDLGTALIHHVCSTDMSFLDATVVDWSLLLCAT